MNKYEYSVGTGAIVFSKDGRMLLLIEEHKAPGRWGIVGGRLEQIPSVANVRKEILEETGFSVSIDGLIGVYQRYDCTPQRISFIYRATALEQSCDFDTKEVVQTRWFKYEEIPWDQLRFEDNRLMIKDALRSENIFPSSIITSIPESAT